MNNFRKLLATCLKLDAEWRDETQEEGYKLSFYNEEKATLTLANVLNTPANLSRLRAELNATGVRYRLIVDEPREKRTNVLLLDIDV